MQADWVVRWPTLGFLNADWIERHCVVPDGFRMGEPFAMYDWQLWCTANHYRVRDTAEVGQLAAAFTYRRSQIVAPQKTGKGPWSAAIVLDEAAGPVVFDGWAKPGEVYRCEQHGCPCGWEWPYEKGDPKGRRWPTPLIQLTATSEDQVDNVYRPLRSMIENGRVGDILPKPTEGFVRVPPNGRIDVVTSNALSRLGNPIIFALQDESGLYTKNNKMVRVAETQRRGAAGMGGRTMETTNCWDPAENSTAQRTEEAALKVDDIFRFHQEPPANLSYGNKRERRKIHAFVYRGSDHVDLDNIEAEAAELMQVDPSQAERFFGNRKVYGSDSWLPDLASWTAHEKKLEVPAGTAICLGFDGSMTDDWTGFRAETVDGHQFTPTFAEGRTTVWDPKEHGGRIPRAEVHAALEHLVERYDVRRVYCDPRDWQTEIEQWAQTYGDDRVIEWATYRTTQMHQALERFVVDLSEAAFTHDGCPLTAQHIANARKVIKPSDRYILAKPSQHQKIDLAMCSALAHEAAADVRAAAEVAEESYVYFA